MNDGMLGAFFAATTSSVGAGIAVLASTPEAYDPMAWLMFAIGGLFGGLLIRRYLHLRRG